MSTFNRPDTSSEPVNWDWSSSQAAACSTCACASSGATATSSCSLSGAILSLYTNKRFSVAHSTHPALLTTLTFTVIFGNIAGLHRRCPSSSFTCPARYLDIFLNALSRLMHLYNSNLFGRSVTRDSPCRSRAHLLIAFTISSSSLFVAWFAAGRDSAPAGGSRLPAAPLMIVGLGRGSDLAQPLPPNTTCASGAV